jgi:hypothetical protein
LPRHRSKLQGAGRQVSGPVNLLSRAIAFRVVQVHVRFGCHLHASEA